MLYVGYQETCVEHKTKLRYVIMVIFSINNANSLLLQDSDEKIMVSSSSPTVRYYAIFFCKFSHIRLTCRTYF